MRLKAKSLILGTALSIIMMAPVAAYATLPTTWGLKTSQNFIGTVNALSYSGQNNAVVGTTLKYNGNALETVVKPTWAQTSTYTKSDYSFTCDNWVQN